MQSMFNCVDPATCVSAGHVRSCKALSCDSLNGEKVFFKLRSE